MSLKTTYRISSKSNPFVVHISLRIGICLEIVRDIFIILHTSNIALLITIVAEKGQLRGKATLTFTTNHGEQKMLVALIPESFKGHSLLHRQAAKLQILELVDQHCVIAANDNEQVSAQLRQQIVDLSVSANVISPFTAFVGVNPDGQGGLHIFFVKLLLLYICYNWFCKLEFGLVK